MSVIALIVTGLAVAAPALAGCGFTSASPSPSSTGSSGDGVHYTAEIAFCVDEVNRLRATVGKPALTRSATLESYAATAVEDDATVRKAHTHALSTNFGNGTARAENEALLWNLSYFKTVKAIVEQSLAQMWREGPGGEHYDIMTGGYAEVGCGIFTKGDEVGVLEAFR